MDDFSAGEFIRGFLEESGEHLKAIRQNLLRLEELLVSEDEAADTETEAEQVQLINELFRSFHTIKGLSGMVGLTEAANLSHAMETVLQAVRSGQAQIQPAMCDQLLEDTRVLQRVIEGLNRPDQDKPETEAVIAQLEHILDEAPASGEEAAQQEVAARQEVAEAQQEVAQQEVAQQEVASQQEVAQQEVASQQEVSRQEVAQQGVATAAAQQNLLALLPDLIAYPEILKALGRIELQKIRHAARNGQVLSLAFFAPSAEKSAQGENVDFVRSRLAQVGTLIKAVPQMQNGAIRFAFLVASAQPVNAADLALDEVVLLVARVVASPDRARDSKAPEAARGASSYPANRSSLVRVELDRLDEMVRYASDLVILRARLGENLDQLAGAPVAVRRELNQTYQQLGRTLRDLRQAILRARMVPLSEVFSLMPLVVRDVARSAGKDVRLQVEGESVEVDKMLVDNLLDPLMHLLRNAVIHGIEPPEERARVGKPARGNLLLRGQPEGDHIRITIRDDGRGVDLARVRQKAETLGWLEAGHEISPADVLELLTRAGFSTRDQADLSAGRGVGLEIVANMVRAVGGSLEMETTPGQGTRFDIRLPLTLMIMDALIVRVGGERYAVPRDMVDEIIEVEAQNVVHLESGDLISYHGTSVVLHSLARLMGLPEGQPAEAASAKTASAEAEPAASSAQGPARCSYGLVRRSSGRPNALHADAAHLHAAGDMEHADAFLVERVENLREVVVHTINEPLIARPGIGGATELGDGRVILIIDLPVLLRMGR